MAFTAVLRFGLSPALLATGAKMPPAGRRTAHKRREDAGEYRDIAAHAGRPGGHKKARPGVGAGGGVLLSDNKITRRNLKIPRQKLKV